MKTLKIFDPAMCCSSGVCGPNVNEELVQLAAFIKGLDGGEYAVERYNLSQQPEAYVANPTVAGMLKEQGTDALPLVLVDDNAVAVGRYPSVDELSDLLQVGHVDLEPVGTGCC